ncbi:MAG TPA: hypothetical protein VFH06_05510 [Candidatus Saccharimonadales bacterium]|nr:hypothetical protein [Candidatus Saccharimonadales bacterium]
MVGNDVVVWDYIDEWLRKIVRYKAPRGDEGFEVNETVAARLREVLREICEDSSVFPHISSDGENGITAVWHAKKYVLQVCVWNDLEVWIFVQGPTTPGRAQKFDAKESQNVKEHLRTLSRHVNRVNPQWRELLLAAT